ncbi:MAG: hypothetical protein ACI4JW_08945 [Oscillospiraceae bacterium]
MKTRFEKIKRVITRYYLVIWIAVVSAALIGVGTFAAYTNINKVKRVVSTQGGEGTAFSSNYLSLVLIETESYGMKRIAMNSADGSALKKVDVTVCNYIQNNPTMVNDNNITYDMTFTLVSTVSGDTITDLSALNLADHGEFKIECGGESGNFENGVCKFQNKTLTGKTKSVDTYTLTVPASFMDTVNIKSEAIPHEDSYGYTDRYKLCRVLVFSENTERNDGWTGSFLEKTSSDYDGFNYILTGQGKGTVTLTWDPSKLEINKLFINKENFKLTESGNENTLTIEVDSDISGRYDIQFYKTGSSDYSDIGSMIKFIYESAEDNSSAA